MMIIEVKCYRDTCSFRDASFLSAVSRCSSASCAVEDALQNYIYDILTPNQVLSNMTTTIPASHPNNFSQLKCSPSTLICREKTVILGDVTIGTDCVIHPTINILAKNGPIIIGNNNLIEERVNIINNKTEPMIIGDHNVFEVDTYCEASKIGDHNILESKSRICANVELTDNCIIGAGCVVSSQLEVDKDQIRRVFPHTVVSGEDLTTRVIADLPTNWQTSQLEFLRKILPNYQKLWRPGGLAGTPQSK